MNFTSFFPLLANILIYSTCAMLIKIIQMFNSLIQYSFLFFNMALVFLFILYHVYVFCTFLDHELETKEPILLFHFISLKFSVNLLLDLKSSLSYQFQVFSFDLRCYVFFTSFQLSNVCSMNYSLVIITLVPKLLSIGLMTNCLNRIIRLHLFI